MITVTTKEVPTMNLTTEHEWTEAQIMRLPEVGGKYELIEGEVLVTPTGYPHEDLVANLISRLRPFVMELGLGRIFSSSLGYWMKSGNLRSPDVSFVAKERLTDMIREGEGFLYGGPDLAVEILSPSYTVRAMKNKVAEYFENDCRLVWLVDPQDESVTVLYPDGRERLIAGETEILSGEDVIPGFLLGIDDLFGDPI